MKDIWMDGRIDGWKELDGWIDDSTCVAGV